MRPTRDRGFALLVVLWSLVLISLLTTQILASSRTAVTLAANISAAAQARARADGAINQAIFHLLATGAGHWPPDGSIHVLAEDGGETLSVRIRVLDDKINPNLASAGLLGGLFQASGATSTQAVQLANAVVQWRSLAVSKQAMQATRAAYQRAGLHYGPAAHPFDDLSELADVIGMPPALFAAATPHMSLYQTCAPDPAHADLAVRRALALSGEPGSPNVAENGSLSPVSIESQVDGPGKLTVRRDAIVSINGVLAPAPFQFLALADGY
jgi:general secretion pathway protein K